MAAQPILLTARADFLQAWRRTLSQGPTRLLATIAAGAGLVAAEVWIAHRLAARLLAVPPLFAPMTEGVLVQATTLVCELALMVAAASAVTLALPAIESVEADPWWAASPLPRPVRALQSCWRVLAGLGWLLILALPPLLTIGLHLRPSPATVVQQVFGLALLLVAAAAAGTSIALVLAALIPRRVLVPLSWTVTTAAVVAAVLWLRHLHPERLVTATETAQLLALLASLGEEGGIAGPTAWAAAAVTGQASPLRLVVLASAGLGVLIVLWLPLSRRAALRLSAGETAVAMPWRAWSVLDRGVAHGPLGVIVASRLRLLVRDTTQASQGLYLVGLGLVYVENLRSLPLHDPLARELAGLINLAMAGLLAAALALRFAYPAHLLEGESHWWWSTGPVPRWRSDLAAMGVASLPSLFLAGGLFAASFAVTGGAHASAVGWWLVPWQAAWLSVLGVALGPRAADPRHGSWVDAALGGGGVLFLALGLGGVGWTVVAAGRQVIAQVLAELGIAWDPGLVLGDPALPVAVISASTVVVVWGGRSRH